MILSDHGIQQAIDAGQLEIDPRPSSEQYTTSAVDLVIGSDFRCWDLERLKLKGFIGNLDLSKQEFQLTAAAFLKRMELDNDGSFIFAPYASSGMHVLCVTRERVSLKPGSKLAARVEGRSSLARLGLVVHLTAPIIHAGFNGQITLEMINYGPFNLKLTPNKTRICQLVFERLESDPVCDINTAFQGQTKPSGER